MTMQNGGATYTGPFLVFDHLNSYDIILGTPFLKSYNLMDNLRDKIATIFGNDVVMYESSLKNESSR